MQRILKRLHGNVTGPGSSVDRGLASWDGTTGKRLRSNDWTISSAGKLKGYSSYSSVNEPASAATITLNLNLDNIHSITLDQATTLAVSNATKGQRWAVRIKQDATGGRTLTWFGGISWPNSATPVLETDANSWSWFGFYTSGLDGYGNPTFDGFVLGENYQ